jgi:hypothetical protein
MDRQAPPNYGGVKMFAGRNGKDRQAPPKCGGVKMSILRSFLAGIRFA